MLAFVAAFVAVNAFVSQWLARRGRAWTSVAVELVAMFAVNFGIVAVLLAFVAWSASPTRARTSARRCSSSFCSR